jgi:hypothetical protein
MEKKTNNSKPGQRVCCSQPKLFRDRKRSPGDPVAHLIKGCMTGATGGVGSVGGGLSIFQFHGNSPATESLRHLQRSSSRLLSQVEPSSEVHPLRHDPPRWGNEGPVAQNSELHRRGGACLFACASHVREFGSNPKSIKHYELTVNKEFEFV